MKYFKLDMGKKDLPDLFATFHEYEEKIERKHMPDDKYPCLRIQVFEPDSNGELDRKKMVAYAELHLDVREIAMKENLVSTAQRTLVRDDANGKARI